MGFKDTITKTFWKGVKVAKKNAPTAELVVGTGLIFAGVAVLIVYADEIADANRKVKQAKEEIKLVDEDETGWDEMGETRSHYIRRTAKEAVVDYAKAAGVGIACVGGGLALNYISHASLSKQLEATAASLASVTYSYNQYRNRVKNDPDAGEEKDFYYYTGCGVKKVVEVETDENGNLVKTEKMVLIKPEGAEFNTQHTFLFDEANPNYTKSPEENLNFIFSALRAANVRLHYRGYITENEIRDCFQTDWVVAGQSAGAIEKWDDGTLHSLRLNPVMMSRLLNGEDPSAYCMIEYDDGTPLADDIWTPELCEKLGISKF